MEDRTRTIERYGFGLTEAQVLRLQSILKSEGVDLTLEQAWARAIELIALFRMLLGPLPEDSSRSERFEHPGY